MCLFTRLCIYTCINAVRLRDFKRGKWPKGRMPTYKEILQVFGMIKSPNVTYVPEDSSASQEQDGMYVCMSVSMYVCR